MEAAINYYEHHLGDWAAATGHLTWDEDMAYTRLLRAYYHHERAIPDGQQYRLAKAATPAQRKAVDQVLAEFFILVDGAHHQKRADAEIDRFQDKQRKAKASADARWSQSGRNANASANAMRTHSEGNAPSLQTPDPIQKPERAPGPTLASVAPPKAAALAQADAESTEAQGRAPTPAGAICRAVKAAGLPGVNPGDPRLLALIAQGVGEDEIVAVAIDAVAGRKGWPWVLHVVAARRTDAASLAVAATPTPAAAADPDAWQRSRDAVVNRGATLGLQWSEIDHTGHAASWPAYRNAVVKADRERREQAA